MNKKGIIWNTTLTLITIVISLGLLILFIYFGRDKIKEYMQVIIDFIGM